MRTKRFTDVLKFLLFVGTGVVILYLVYQNQNAAYQEECLLQNIPAAECSLADKVLRDFQSANYAWVLVVLLCFTLSNVSRALRWNMLLRPMGYRPRLLNSFFSIVLGYFANLGFPRLGEVVRAGTLSRYEHIEIEKAMGTIVMGRLVDVISILLVTALALLLEYDNLTDAFLRLTQTSDSADGSATSNSLFAMIALATLLVAGLLLVVFRSTILSSTAFQKIKKLIIGFWQGLQSIRKVQNIPLFVAHSLFIWTMYFTMTWLCFYAFAPTAHLGPVAGLLVFVFGACGIVIPSPGGMGTYHFLVIAALALYGIDGDDAFSFANIAFFSIQIGCNILLGVLALVVLPLINNQHQTPSEVLGS